MIFIKVAICDDEHVQLELMAHYTELWRVHATQACQIERFESAEAFLFKYEETKDYNVLFLDIQMKEVSGMELAHKLRSLGEQVAIVFITGNPEYVFEGYGVQALDYILKPVQKEKLFQVLDRVQMLQPQQEDYVFVECSGVLHKVKQKDICSIESIGHDTVLHLLEKELTCKKGISTLEKEINEHLFYRCHRSYLVNVARIHTISRKEVVVETGQCIPIARGKWEGLNKAYLDFYRGVLCL